MDNWEKKGLLTRNAHPWWASTPLKRPPGDDPWANAPAKGATEAKIVQPYVSKVITKLAKAPATRLRLVDAWNKVSYFNRKPDIVICPAEHASGESHPAAFYIVAVGDVKGRRLGSEEFNDDEIGRMISFLIDLLRTRPDRSEATGFLIDGYIIQFIRVTIMRSAAGPGYKCDVTMPFVLPRATGTGAQPCGGDWLHSLLSQDPVVLGCPTTELSVDGTTVEITRYLGEGSSSVVWQGRHKERDVVVKVFRTGHEKDLTAEIRNLAAVKNLTGVPKFVGSHVSGGSGGGVLLLSPVGTPFSSHGHGGTILPSAEHFAQLVGIVKAAHDEKINLLHRDLSLANFFLGPDGKVRHHT